MIIEFKEQFREFLNIYKDNDVLIIPVYSDINLHVNMNKLCALYIQILKSGEYYFLPFRHSECINLPDTVINLLNTQNKKYIYNKKRFIQLYEFDNMIDIESMYYLNTGKSLDLNISYNSSQNHVINISDKLLWVNEYIPVVKLLDHLNGQSKELCYIIQTSFALSFDEYKSIDIPIRIFSNIEKNGICVDVDKMKSHFSRYSKYFQFFDTNIIYSEYNLYTLTGRPANSFLHMNFAALNKSNGERECIISRFDGGKLLYLDYSSYHLSLIANILKYDFPKDISIHEYLGRYYYGKDVLTAEEYEDSKRMSFKFLYGGIPKEIANNIPFFGKVNLLIETKYLEFKSNGYIKTHFFKRKLYIDPVGLTKNKIFNYYIQSLETEFNIKVLHLLNKYLEDKKSKLILYLYDGFLFDVHPDEHDELDNNISNIISDDKFSYVKYIGNNFQNMQKI